MLLHICVWWCKRKCGKELFVHSRSFHSVHESKNKSKETEVCTARWFDGECAANKCDYWFHHRWIIVGGPRRTLMLFNSWGECDGNESNCYSPSKLEAPIHCVKVIARLENITNRIVMVFWNILLINALFEEIKDFHARDLFASWSFQLYTLTNITRLRWYINRLLRAVEGWT